MRIREVRRFCIWQKLDDVLQRISKYTALVENEKMGRFGRFNRVCYERFHKSQFRLDFIKKLDTNKQKKFCLTSF